MPSSRDAGPRGTLRARLTLVLTAAFGVLAAGAAVALTVVQTRALGQQLDASLRAHASSEALTAIDRPDGRAHLHDAPVAVAGAPDALRKFAALYDARGGVLARTATFRGAAPALASLPPGAAFDLTLRGERLRAVLVPMGPETAARWLLLAVPRRTLDAAQRTALLATAGLLAVAFALVALVAAAIARWLTRDLDAIAATARAVAAGDLDARVGPVGGVREVRTLATDLDEMIGRLGAVVAAQRRFVSDAAHELRTPLTSLRGELELALRRPRSPAEYEATLGRARDDVLALVALSEDLLALARARSAPAVGAPRTSLAEAAVGAAALLQREAESRGVRIVIAGVGAAVPVAPRDLERVVRNLVENAVRHAPSGSVVTVTLDASGDAVTLAVCDEGPGVPGDQAERIFEPFVRLDPARSRDGDSGLGLAIAREVARAHGGDVSLDAAHANGARFVVWLPLASDAPGALAGRGAT